MKLISKLHDYYDSPFRQSVADPKFVFVRESSKFQIENTHFIEWSCESKGRFYNFTSGVVGFCGKIYPYIQLDSSHNSGYGAVQMTKEHYYTMEDFKRNHPDIVNGQSKLSRWSSRYVSRLSDIEQWLKSGTVSGWQWSYTATTDQNLLKLFMEKRIAYFVVEGPHSRSQHMEVVIYPLLKNYSFYKMYDVYTTFQKIEIFLMNELIRPDEITIKICDKMKVHTHGFDKWSFRKESKKKK